MRRGIEEAIKIGRIVQYPDMAVRRRFPLNHWQQPAGVVFQNGAVLINPVQYRGRDREHHASRIETTLCEHMVDQVAMQVAVSVLKGTESSSRSTGRRPAPPIARPHRRRRS